MINNLLAFNISLLLDIDLLRFSLIYNVLPVLMLHIYYMIYNIVNMIKLNACHLYNVMCFFHVTKYCIVVAFNRTIITIIVIYICKLYDIHVCIYICGYMYLRSMI